MSLAIRTSKITGVYALGEWYQVCKGTFRIDAYELIQELEPSSDKKDHYQLGLVYPKTTHTKMPPPRPGSIGEHWHFMSPQGHHGCQWIDPASKAWVSMSLLEIKAWKEASDDEE